MRGSISSEERRAKRPRIARASSRGSLTPLLTDLKDVLKRKAPELIRKLEAKDHYAIFHEPVPDDVPGYAETISRPMDFSTLRHNIEAGLYRTYEEFKADVELIWSNCLTFNTPDSIYAREALRLREVARRLLAELARAVARSTPSYTPSRERRPGRQRAHAASSPSPPPRKPTPSRSPSSSPSAEPAPTREKEKEKEIFLGPVVDPREERLRKASVPPSLRASLEKPPEEWLALGRRHSGSSVPPILTSERAAETAFGKAYRNFVKLSAPSAKRILATVLHPDTVEEYDRKRRKREEGRQGEEKRVTIPNGVARSAAVRRKSGSYNFDIIEHKLAELIGKEQAKKVCRGNRGPVPISTEAIIELNNILIEQQIDVSFITELLNSTTYFLRRCNPEQEDMFDASESKGQKRVAEGGDTLSDFQRRARENAAKLLEENYNLIQDVRRLRALSEDELRKSEKAKLESLINKCSARLLRNLRSLANELPPKLITNPIDVSRAAQILISSILAQHPPKKRKSQLKKTNPAKETKEIVNQETQPVNGMVK